MTKTYFLGKDPRSPVGVTMDDSVTSMDVEVLVQDSSGAAGRSNIDELSLPRLSKFV